ncbi:hypothetical protein ABZX12_09925 [Kribbella sp. NPDC003505]|uniref:hypothetical protein n=1 Tax=Kribbella sp. NPDC003505 TaxID=3154448 RepID=UPI0033A1DF6D
MVVGIVRPSVAARLTAWADASSRLSPHWLSGSRQIGRRGQDLFGVGPLRIQAYVVQVQPEPPIREPVRGSARLVARPRRVRPLVPIEGQKGLSGEQVHHLLGGGQLVPGGFPPFGPRDHCRPSSSA